MVFIDMDLWQPYCVDPDFQEYLRVCKSFDPVGFERAIKHDEESNHLDFRRVIVEAYLEDARAGIVATVSKMDKILL